MADKYRLEHRVDKIKITRALMCLIFLFACNNVHAKKTAERLPLEQRQENYIEIQNLNLNNKELEKFGTISTMEYTMLRPIALQLESCLLRLDELNQTKCKFYQRQCKKELKKNKAFIAGDIKELKRQIRQKKEYYKILYINETTRAQHLMLRETIKNITNDKMQLW